MSIERIGRPSNDLFGYPKDYLSTWRENIGAVTAQQASQGSRLFDVGLQIMVVGPPEKLGGLSRVGPVTTIADVGMISLKVARSDLSVVE